MYLNLIFHNLTIFQFNKLKKNDVMEKLLFISYFY